MSLPRQNLILTLLDRLAVRPRRVARVVSQAGLPAGLSFAERVRRALGLRVDLDSGEWARVPKQGSLLILAPRPYGLIEAVGLAESLLAQRPDLRFFEDALLQSDPEGAKLCVEAVAAHRDEAAEAHLRGGGALLVFVSQKLASGKPCKQGVPPEALHLAALARRSHAAVQVLDLDGGKRRVFLRAFGLDKPGLRRLRLSPITPSARPRLKARLGTSLPAERLAAYDQESEAAEMLLLRFWLLKHRGKHVGKSSLWRPRLKRQRNKPLASRLPAELLQRELAGLSPAAKLAEAAGLQVWLAQASEIPNLLREIGRTREETFRAVGEGTGQPLDLDAYDHHYLHLFLWDPAKSEIAGGYRLGATDRILAEKGLRGFYTHSLLRFKPGLIQHLDPGLELGRSYVTRAWQRSFAPLMLLWKGIGAFVAENPRYRRLFGVVSMSAEYQPLSRELIASYVKQHLYRGDLAKLTRPTRPFGPAYRPSRHDAVTWRLGHGLDELDDWISELEPDGKGLPVLFKQYSKLGGYFFGFNLDPAFGNALDGMVCVDLLKTEPRVLIKYLGPVGAARFMAHHKLNPVAG
jgi:putative hemolysin